MNLFGLLFLAIPCLALSAELTAEEKEIMAFEAPEVLKKEMPYYLSGYDEDNLPVWVAEIGRWDIRKFVEPGGESYKNISIYGDQIMLTFRESGRNAAGEKKGFVIIVDMDGYSLRQFSHPQTVQMFFLKFKRIEESIKTGDLDTGIFINANFLFEQLWTVGKGLLGALQEKIEMFGTNPEKWKARLLKRLPKEAIPEIYGGKEGNKFIKFYGKK